MPRNEREVFGHLCLEEEDSQTEIAYMAYAVFALRQHFWAEKFEQVHQRAPDQSEIDEWISEISDYEFEAMKTEAAAFFHDAAVEYMKDKVQAARIAGREESLASSVTAISSQIKAVGSIKSQLLIALLTAILVPPILGGFIFAIREFDRFMPTISTFMGDPTNLPASPLPSPAQPK